MPKNRLLATAIAGVLVLSAVGCQEDATLPMAVEMDQPLLAAGLDMSSTIDPAAVASIIQQVDQFNANLAAAGSDLRLDYPWLFQIGLGTDPFARLRTGSRWNTPTPTYILDASDYTTDIPAGGVDATLVTAFDHWNNIPNGNLAAVRVADPGHNMDVIDGLYDIGGNCVFLFDLTSPNLDFFNGLIFPAAHVVMGGWPSTAYFSQCLGSSNIIGVTWTFSGPDTDGDQYRDRQYVEQFYNPAFTWVTSGSMFLNPSTGVDLETIASHENGHAHGLGHFGGPVNRQPFTLKPNGRVYNPEAVMNPFYLFGEKRVPLPTDVAGFLTMYGR